MPIMAMNEKVVPVRKKNHITPMIAKNTEVIILDGKSTDSNSDAMTR